MENEIQPNIPNTSNNAPDGVGTPGGQGMPDGAEVPVAPVEFVESTESTESVESVGAAGPVAQVMTESSVVDVSQPEMPQPNMSGVPSAAEPSKKKSKTGLIVVLVVAGIAVIVAIVCLVMFLNSGSVNNQNVVDDAVTPTQPEGPEEVPIGAVVEDGEWNVTFPGYTVEDLTVYDETISFGLPTGLTGIDYTMRDLTSTAESMMSFSITGLTTETGNYDAETICGYDGALETITIGGVMRQPATTIAPVIDGASIQEVNEIGGDDFYKYYVWIGLEDAMGSCQLNATKYAEAKALLEGLFGTNVAEE